MATTAATIIIMAVAAVVVAASDCRSFIFSQRSLELRWFFV
jgi:hypothetical protein